MSRDPDGMKSMKLYEQVERIHNELRALGIDEESPLALEDLTPFDQYHYHGTEACDEAIAALGLSADSRVLEVGAGIGGPARYIAHQAACQVTALELQGDLNETAAGLTARCRLNGTVEHVCGNMLDGPFRGGDFDAVTSLLCFLHIPDRDSLFRECLAALKPGGQIYIEDFTKLVEPSEAQWTDLRREVQCSHIPTAQAYQDDLERAGFEAVSMTDMSNSWRDFVTSRFQAFLDRKEQNRRIHGDAVVEGLETFYRVVAELFEGQVVGGARILARRPL